VGEIDYFMVVMFSGVCVEPCGYVTYESLYHNLARVEERSFKIIIRFGNLVLLHLKVEK
jgi:hypothetical protein